jgi:diguanylate cyclase
MTGHSDDLKGPTRLRQLILRLGRIQTVLALTVTSMLLAMGLTGVITVVIERSYSPSSVLQGLVTSALVAVIVVPIVSWYVVGLLFEVHGLEIEMRLQATRDSLTGLFNRGHFVEAAELEVARAIRHGRALSVVMLDLDEFKDVNDRLGHAAGDEVLRQVSARIRACLREIDIVGRVGGEEFALVLPEASLAAAADVAELTQSGPSPLSTFDALLLHADRALYVAKRGGRNQVHSYAIGD